MPTETVAEPPAQEPVSCALCGRQAPAESTVLTWTTAVENGRRRSYCDACSRQHLRSIEGKLDSEYW